MELCVEGECDGCVVTESAGCEHIVHGAAVGFEVHELQWTHLDVEVIQDACRGRTIAIKLYTSEVGLSHFDEVVEQLVKLVSLGGILLNLLPLDEVHATTMLRLKVEVACKDHNVGGADDVVVHLLDLLDVLVDGVDEGNLLVGLQIGVDVDVDNGEQSSGGEKVCTDASPFGNDLPCSRALPKLQLFVVDDGNPTNTCPRTKRSHCIAVGKRV